MPLLGDPGHAGMVEFLEGITPTLGQPSAILVVSAHWEEPIVTLTSAEAPPLLYDYYGFPEVSYQIRYPAPGHPALAEEIAGLLRRSGIEARLDRQRGFDHGLFVPLKLMYPAANIPCLQMSLVSGLDPALHLRIGSAISGLRERNVLVLGSGFSFHNLRAFFTPGPGDPKNELFQQWLVDTSTKDLSQGEREKALIDWERAPHARYCHPREEHLLPLHVCAGTAGAAAKVVFDGDVLGKRAVALLWK
jgi:4,5-DOPA dioxygenase extradiol